jgi:hypothetical protein
MALTLVNEQADEVVATLYEDYCRKVGAAHEKARPKVTFRTGIHRSRTRR